MEPTLGKKTAGANVRKKINTSARFSISCETHCVWTVAVLSRHRLEHGASAPLSRGAHRAEAANFTPNREPKEYSRNVIEYKAPGRYVTIIFLLYAMKEALIWI